MFRVTDDHAGKQDDGNFGPGYKVPRPCCEAGGTRMGSKARLDRHEVPASFNRYYYGEELQIERLDEFSCTCGRGQVVKGKGRHRNLL